MKKIATLLAATLCFAACQPQEEPVEKYRDALPKSQAVQIGVPEAETAPGALTVERSALGQTPDYKSEYAVMSYWTAATVNVGVWWTLELLQLITSFPPSSCDEGSCTWGPWLGDQGLNFYTLVVHEVNRAYEYTLFARSAAATQPPPPWVELIAGVAHPGADRDHGSGTFDIFFDAHDALQHAQPDWKRDHGTLTVQYDNTAGLFIQAELRNGRNDDPDRLDHVMNAAYRFDQTGTDGDLQIAFQDVTVGDSVTLHTRWKRHDGAGRGDAHYVGAGGSQVFDASECWVGGRGVVPWAEVYDTKIGFGAEANCAFIPADYADLPFPAAQ
jgi:hypothetical protein